MRKEKKNIRDIKENIPIVRYDKQKECFLRKDQGYMDIYLILPKDLVNGDPDEIEMDCFAWAKFYKTCGVSVEIVSMMYPCDTGQQQEYWKNILEKNENPIYEPMIRRKIEELEYREKHTVKKEFFLVCFFATEEELAAGRKTLDSSLGIQRLEKERGGSFNLISEISERKKRQVLFKFANKNSQIF